MFYWKVTPKVFPSLIGQSVTIVAMTMVAQNHSVGLGAPSNNVNFLLTLFNDQHKVENTLLVSRENTIRDFTQMGLPEAAAIAFWENTASVLTGNDDDAIYAKAVELATTYGYELLPKEEQTGNLVEPQTQSEEAPAEPTE